MVARWLEIISRIQMEPEVVVLMFLECRDNLIKRTGTILLPEMLTTMQIPMQTL